MILRFFSGSETPFSFIQETICSIDFDDIHVKTFTKSFHDSYLLHLYEEDHDRQTYMLTGHRSLYESMQQLQKNRLHRLRHIELFYRQPLHGFYRFHSMKFSIDQFTFTFTHIIRRSYSKVHFHIQSDELQDGTEHHKADEKHHS